MPVLPIDWPESLILVASRVWTIGRGNKDYVPFVALDVFKILDKKPFRPGVHTLLVLDSEWIGSHPLI